MLTTELKKGKEKMCVIAYKPENTRMPEKAILRNCFNNNPDGAGFMFVKNNKVHIKKGFMTFNDFYSALSAYKPLWYNSPFTLHFRISTQAGINKECTHPFPLSTDMTQLRKLKIKTDVGIAHNGIISLTSNYWNKTITYSDTMEFITDYLTLIIDNKYYYKDKNKVELIEKLAESKLLIMSSNGHCEMIGHFIKDDGVYYSNASYMATAKKVDKINNDILERFKCFDNLDDDDIDDGLNDEFTESLYDDIDDIDDDLLKKEVMQYYDYATDRYYFDNWCPVDVCNSFDYCNKCADYHKCMGGYDNKYDDYEYSSQLVNLVEDNTYYIGVFSSLDVVFCNEFNNLKEKLQKSYYLNFLR